MNNNTDTAQQLAAWREQNPNATEAHIVLEAWRIQRNAAEQQLAAVMAAREPLVAWAYDRIGQGGLQEVAERMGISRTTATDDLGARNKRIHYNRTVRLLRDNKWDVGSDIHVMQEGKGVVTVMLGFDIADSVDVDVDANSLNAASALLNLFHDQHVHVDLVDKDAPWHDRVDYVARGGELRVWPFGAPIGAAPRPTFADTFAQ